ncbi:hypothetical protein Tco_0181849, partial [Tanacetum coccineum]
MMGCYFYYSHEHKIIVSLNAKIFENSLISQEDMHPSENTSDHHNEVKHEIVKQQSNAMPICRSVRTHHTPAQLCLYVDYEEHGLRDHGEPANYKATLSDTKSGEWLKTMNAKMHSMKCGTLFTFLLMLRPLG